MSLPTLFKPWRRWLNNTRPRILVWYFLLTAFSSVASILITHHILYERIYDQSQEYAAEQLRVFQQSLQDQPVYGRSSSETAAVGTHTAGATADGIQDMAGNVAEWTSSLYRPYPYRAEDGREQPDDRGEQVTRGGDHVFDSASDRLTAYFRTGFSRAPDRGHRHIGFRCAQQENLS